MQSENPWYIQTAELAEMLFPEAGELWLASRTPHISRKPSMNMNSTSGHLAGLLGKRNFVKSQPIRFVFTRQCGPAKNVGHRGSIMSAPCFSRCSNASANGMRSSRSTKLCDFWIGAQGASCLRMREPGCSRCLLAKRIGKAHSCLRCCR